MSPLSDRQACAAHGALEDLHVLRDGVERHVEGLGEVGYARGALRQPLDDLSARRVRERREGEVENRGRHIFNLWVEYGNWPALVKRSSTADTIALCRLGLHFGK